MTNFNVPASSRKSLGSGLHRQRVPGSGDGHDRRGVAPSSRPSWPHSGQRGRRRPLVRRSWSAGCCSWSVCSGSLTRPRFICTLGGPVDLGRVDAACDIQVTKVQRPIGRLVGPMPCAITLTKFGRLRGVGRWRAATAVRRFATMLTGDERPIGDDVGSQLDVRDLMATTPALRHVAPAPQVAESPTLGSAAVASVGPGLHRPAWMRYRMPRPPACPQSIGRHRLA
jgi:hypothetical protein